MNYEGHTPAHPVALAVHVSTKRTRTTTAGPSEAQDHDSITAFTVNSSSTAITSAGVVARNTTGDLVDVSSSNKENNKVDSVEHVIAEIHSAMTTKQRLVALKHLHQMLQSMQQQQQQQQHEEVQQQHHGAALNNPTNLLETGLINALSLQLHCILHRHGSTTVEMELMCHCLCLVFQRCRKQHKELQLCIQEQGTPFVDMLTQAIGIELRQRSLQSTNSIPSALYSVLSLFSIISSSALGTSLLLQSRDVGVTIVSCLSDPKVPDATIAEILGTLKNMTYFDEDCRIILVKLPDMLSALTALPNYHHRPLSIKSRHRLLGIVRNLSTTAECRAILIRQPSFVGLLARFMMADSSSDNSKNDESTAQENQIFRRSMFNTLISLAMDQESSLLLLLHGDGILLRLLHAYWRTSIQADDSDTRKSVARILRLLAHEASVPLLIHNTELMHQLSDAALRDSCAAVRTEAAEAFTRCAALARAETSGQHSHYYEAVLDALQLLVQQQQQSRAVSRDVLAQALREQSMHPGNRAPLGKRSILLQTVTQIALERGVSSVTAVRDACCTLLHLSLEESNRQDLVQVPNLLDALMTNLSSFSQGDQHDHVDAVERDHAMQTVVNLAQCSANGKTMARHGCLLSTLIQIAGNMHHDNVVKADLKQTILLLVTNL